jgi:hypothetical protein
LEYLLCYAAAGHIIVFCVMDRDTNKLERISDELNLMDRNHRLSAINIVIKLFSVLQLQTQQLPTSDTLMDLQHFSNGTTILLGDTWVEKTVQLSQQPALALRVQDMKGVYKAVENCRYIIQGTTVSFSKQRYRVTLRPRGVPLNQGWQPRGMELVAAIRCV